MNGNHITIATIALLCAVCTGAIAQKPAARAAGVDSPTRARTDALDLDAVAAEWADAVNSGDEGRWKSFLEKYLSAEARNAGATADFLETMRGLHRHGGGGVEVVRRDAQGPDVLRLTLRARRGGDAWAHAFVVRDAAEPNRLRWADARPTGNPERPYPLVVAAGKERLTESEAVREVERAFAGAAAADRFSGVVLIARGDRPVLVRAYGTAEKDWDVANTTDTRFNLGSMGKMFTAVAIAQLVEAGKLAFDTPVADVLPEYPDRAAAAKMTIHHLLTHTSGISDTGPNVGAAPAPSQSAGGRSAGTRLLPAVGTIGRRALAFEPGKGFEYTNGGYGVLGAVIEKVSGESFYDYVENRVLKPAGMRDTGYFRLDEIVPRRAVGYYYKSDDPFGVGPRRPNHDFLGMRGNASGGCFSTAADLLRFAAALRSGKLVKPETLTKMTTPHARRDATRLYGYATILIDVRGRPTWGHGGGGPGSGVSADLRTFADGSYTAVVLQNQDWPSASLWSATVMDVLARVAGGEAP